MSGSKYLSSLS